MNGSTKSYLKDVRSAFPVFKKNEKRFFNDFKVNISEYESIHPDCNTEDLVCNFGTSKEVVVDYFNNMDSEKYLLLMKKSFYMKIVTLTALVLLFVFFVYQTFSLYQVRKVAMETIITSEDVKIVYDTE